MIYINECKRHNTNTFGLLKKTARKELSEHNGVQCICSSRFTKFMEKRNLGESSNHNGRTSSVVKGIITRKCIGYFKYLMHFHFQ